MSKSLFKPVFIPLRTSEIRPEGWLLNQLKIQASGLSGNLDKFWPDIMDSQWIGGSSEGWERVPYWLDGFIPLAWLLDDDDMKARANKYVNSIIDLQGDDGWICPQNNTDRRSYDMWALFLMLKVLVVYYEATEDERIEGVVFNALKALDRHINDTTIFNWAHTRWFECLISIFWLYERKEEEWLLHLSSKLHSQGFDWQSFYKLWPYKKPDPKGHWSQMSHVVNNAMMIKSGALLWRLTGCESDLNSSENMVKLLDEYHGMVTGVFSGDECLNGTSPIQGTELCAVAEYMYSLEILSAISGRVHWIDRLEKIAFNALPATFSPDMWAHQYDQQVNQVQCSFQENPIFTTNNGYAHTFGLEPNFGCCTANLSQPWPKFALSTFMRCDDGLASTIYAPCSVKTEINNVNVSIILDTNYPFSETINFKVVSAHEVEFALYLRIPEWANGSSIHIDRNTILPIAGEFYKLKRKWKGETEFSLTLLMKTQLVQRPNKLYAVVKGPLVYSLFIDEQWVKYNENMALREFPHCDYEVYPKSPWNYSLCINKNNLESFIKFEYKSIGDCPFSPEGAPIIAIVKGKKIPWAMENGSATSMPEPIDNGFCCDDVDAIETLKLIPYGCTNLRMTEMPLVANYIY